MGNSREELFERAPIPKAIAAMALPVMLMMINMIFYNMADMFFISRLGDSVMVAAVSVVGPVFALVMAVGSLIGAGGSVLLARSLGEGKRDECRRISCLCCTLGLFLGILLTAVLLMLTAPLLTFLGANEEIAVYAAPYLRILALGAPALVLSATFGNVIRSAGLIKEGMIAQLAGTLTNMLLDPLLILVLGMGVSGAAVATVLGNIVSVLLLAVFTAGSDSLALRPAGLRGQTRRVGEILTIGLPNLASTALSSFASAFGNRMLVGYGTTAVAAMAAAGKGTMVIAMLEMGLCMGVQPLMSYSYGAGNRTRLRQIAGSMAVLTFCLGTGLSLVCFLGGRQVVSLFLEEETAVAVSTGMLRTMVLAGPLIGFYYLSSNYLQATGCPGLATMVSVLRQGAVLIPALLILNRLFGMQGIVAAHALSDGLSAVIGLLTLLWARRGAAKQFSKAVVTPRP